MSRAGAATFGMAVLAGLFTIPGRAESPAQLLARLDAAASSFTSATASVQVTNYTAIVNESEIESGTMAVRRSGKNQFEYLVANTGNVRSYALRERTVEIYYPKTNTIQPYDLRKFRDVAQQLVLLGFGMAGRDLTAQYEIRLMGADAAASQSATHIELIPKSPELARTLKKIEIWFSLALPCPIQQKFDLGEGNYKLVTYSDVKINPRLANSALDFPKGARREPVQ